MQIHVLVTLLPSAVLHETRSSSLDLNSASSFLLDMLNIGTPMANNLSTKIESLNWYKVNRYLLLWPFTLSNVSMSKIDKKSRNLHDQIHPFRPHLVLVV
jgi:hypothetical protein